jgi:N-acetylglucosaminyl-diphospho-decaprenol L-rhamnosyltransferase
MDQTDFTSLIVTYNSAQEASDLLADLRLYAPGSPVIVVDNASLDRTADIIGDQFPEVRLIRNSHNLGYAKAVNQGFAFCTSKYVLLLNPDIRIPASAVFKELLACIERSAQVAAVGPLQFKVEDNEQRLNFTSSYWSLRAFGVYLSYLLHQERKFSQPIRVTLINAGCMLIRRSAYEQVGGLNQKYFLYGEEPDLGLKFKRYGYECRLLPNIGVIHYRERSMQTVPARKRLRIRLQAILNISDAYLTGWTRIILDNLSGKKPYSSR